MCYTLLGGHTSEMSALLEDLDDWDDLEELSRDRLVKVRNPTIKSKKLEVDPKEIAPFPRELEVIWYVSQKLTNREIAEAMGGIKLKTVKATLWNMSIRYGVHGRHELVKHVMDKWYKDKPLFLEQRQKAA